MNSFSIYDPMFFDGFIYSIKKLNPHTIQSTPDFLHMKYYFFAEMMLNDTDGNPNRRGGILSHSGG
jgi:hypothetical protein